MVELMEKPVRRYELDWLRVLIILNLIPFHAIWLMAYIPGFSLAPPEGVALSIIYYYICFIAYWQMPLLFFVAGTTSCLSLNYRSTMDYLKERTKRLLIPLVFFMLFVYPLTAYFLPGSANDRNLSDYVLRFWPQCLRAPHNSWSVGRPVLPGWGHLWFVAYLLLYSFIALPLFLRCKKSLSNSLPNRYANIVRKRGGIFLLGITFVVVMIVLVPKWPMFYQHNLYQDWAYFFYNLVAFILGFIFSLNERFWQSTERYLRFSVPLAIVSSIIVLVLRLNIPTLSTPAYSVRYLPFAIIFGFNTWFWILVLLSLARRYLSHSNRFLRYFKRASYPFYILHLTVMIPIGYFIVQWQTGVICEFLIISVLTFTATLGIYELFVKRIKITRFLFGMKT